MKRLVPIPVALILAAAIAAGCNKAPSPPAPPPPTPLPPVESPAPEPPASAKPLEAVVFVSPEVGWAGGENRILTTADGGKSWTVAYESAMILQDLAFADTQHGWAVTRDRLLRTTDGGKHWEETSRTPLSHVLFADPNRGWGITEQGALLQSSDGGATWAPAPTPSPVDALCPAGGTTVWASGSNQVIRSEDGGKTWSVIFSAPLEGTGWRTRLGCSAGSAWVQFYGQGAMSQQSHVLFRTADDGKNWSALEMEGMFASMYPTVKAEYTIDAYSAPFAILSDHAGVFLGECPACNPGSMVSFHRTADGGKTWTQTKIPILTSAAATSFVSPDKGWVAGRTANGNAIMATSDGGATWQQVYP